MEYRQLQQTELKVSSLCLGTMTFGMPVGREDAKTMVGRCIDAGINFFDTANIYQKGIAEETLGVALGEHRSKIVLATKVFHRMGDGPNDAGLSSKAICNAVEASLKRLRTDYIDLYYFHQPDYAVAVDESLEAMETLIRTGKVRYPATSNYASWQVCEMLLLAEKQGYRPVSVAQQMYSLLARGIEQEFLPMAKQMHVSTLAYNPLAAGLLTGKYTDAAIAPGTRFDNNKMYQDRYWHPQNFTAVQQLQQIAIEDGRSLISLALNWMLHHTPIASVILGASDCKQLDQNLSAALERPLADETLRRCAAVWQELRGPVPQYNR